MTRFNNNDGPRAQKDGPIRLMKLGRIEGGRRACAHKLANFRTGSTSLRPRRRKRGGGPVSIMRDNKVYIGQNRGILHYDLDNRLLAGVHGYRALIMLIACTRCRRIN